MSSTGDLRGRALWVVLGCFVCQMGLGFGYSFGALAPEMLAELGGPVLPLVQGRTESESDLAQRVRAGHEHIRRRGGRVERGMLVAKPGFDLPDVPGAADLLRVLASPMVEQGEGVLVLQAGSPDTRSRLALTALADAIGDQLRGTGVEVEVRDSEPSQTFVLAEVKARQAG